MYGCLVSLQCCFVAKCTNCTNEATYYLHVAQKRKKKKENKRIWLPKNRYSPYMKTIAIVNATERIFNKIKA